MLVNIANEQAKLGASISVVIINDLTAPELLQRIDNRVEVIRINRKRRTYSLGFISQINHALDELNPDVIHLHRSEIRNFISDRRARTSSVVATIHALPTGRIGMAWRWGSMAYHTLIHDRGNVCAINRVDKIFSISKSVAEGLLNDYGLKSEVVFNGIETSKFQRREILVPKDGLRIVQVSRLEHDNKGQDLLIEAVSLLKKEYGKSVKLTFIGDGSSHEYLEKLVSDKGLKENVYFMGACSQKYISGHLKDYDLFVQPSRFEGFGLTVAEAMAACVPVLVSSGQGPAEVTEGDRYGWTFVNSNIEDLAGKINYIICHYDEALRKVDSACLHVCKNYDVSVTAKKYMEEYERLGLKESASQ